MTTTAVVLSVVLGGLPPALAVAAVLWPRPAGRSQRAGDEPGQVHTGADLLWSPRRQVAAVAGEMDEAEAEARRELAAAEADLRPVIDAMRRELAGAFRAFDAAVLPAMATVTAWHSHGRDECLVCRADHDRTIGQVGQDGIGLRAFRMDTPTGELPVMNVKIKISTQRAARALLVS